EPLRCVASCRRPAVSPSPAFLGPVPPSAGGGARPALFFDLLGMALMSCHYIDFVAFHLAAERDLWLPLNDTLTKLSGHLLSIVTIQIQLMSNLLIREIQPHEVKAEHPHAQRLVVTGKDRPGEVVEPLPTGVALILLSFRLRFVASLFRDLGRVAVGAGDPLEPTHRSDGLKAPGIVDEVQYVEHPCTHHPSW